MKKAFTVIELLVGISIVALLLAIGFGVLGSKAGPFSGFVGAFPFGEKNYYQNTLIVSKHVDSAKSTNSSYMVTTEAGEFEVDNSWLLSIYNADEIYGKLIVGKRYNITTKGKKCLNFILQAYPCIIEASLVPEPNEQK